MSICTQMSICTNEKILVARDTLVGNGCLVYFAKGILYNQNKENKHYDPDAYKKVKFYF